MIGGLDVGGRSTDRDRSEGKVLGLIERFSKRKRAGGMSGHGGRLTGVYPDTIEFRRAHVTGAGGHYLAECFVMGLIGTCLFTVFALEGALRNEVYGVVCFAYAGSWMFFAFFTYLELFAPADSPIYFDRKHRKV
ncbi:hypothetical protein QTI51_31085 [Variovorax sp. J22G73]|uniref:hypothetical protein n=1 Tax=unclassified Variovorax TaxID=663243 RepID=UPI002576534E|nr:MULTISPECIES: hypothetical protein [unclassified Variovorax]MDM0009304.1 hypothetical protein [Variovorax sp. J22R203]MDM0101760.1 hypothetical protein [Variovorax sp. J22G73]